MTRSKEILFLFFMWALTIGGIRALDFFTGIAFVNNNLLTLTAMLQIYPPLMVAFARRERFSWLSYDVLTLKKSALAYLVICLAIFPLGFVINHYYQGIVWKAPYHASLPSNWTTYIVTQLLLVGFPEEFFFRGFLQTRIVALLPPSRNIFGARLGLAHIITALVFAFSHSLIQMRWWHGFIFFPALLFGWLRERTGSIWAGTLFHATCNFFAYWVYLHYG